MIIKFKKLTRTAKLPAYAHPHDAGMDIYADDDIIIRPGETVRISTGIASELEDGYVALIWDKSGIGTKGVHRLAGVIDSGYRGEWLVVMHNLSQQDYKIEKGDKIAQALIQKVEHPQIRETQQLNESPRNAAGFGSTGKN